jgi:hypothetical protein
MMGFWGYGGGSGWTGIGGKGITEETSAIGLNLIHWKMQSCLFSILYQ